MTTTSGHLSKKELQTDEVIEGARTGLDWLKSHSRETLRAAGIFGAVVVVIAAAAGFLAWRRASSGKALSAGLTTLEAPLTSDPAVVPFPGEATFPDADTRAAKAAEYFEKASGAGTPAGRAALLDRASALVAKGDYPKAWELLEKAASSGDGLIRGWAEYNLILVGPAAGKSTQVVERINRMLAQAEPPLPGDVLLLSLGDLQLREGKTAEAKAAYQQLVTRFPDSRLRFDVQQKLQSL